MRLASLGDGCMANACSAYITVPLIFSARSPAGQPRLACFNIVVGTEIFWLTMNTRLVTAGKCSIALVSFLSSHKSSFILSWLLSLYQWSRKSRCKTELNSSLSFLLLIHYIKTPYVLSQGECLVHESFDLRFDADRRRGSKGSIVGRRLFFYESLSRSAASVATEAAPN